MSTEDEPPNEREGPMGASRLPLLCRIGIKLNYDTKAALDIERCLQEEFERRAEKYGASEAQRWLRLETAAFIVPKILRASWLAVVAYIKSFFKDF